mmetsp:Transcript_901/g.1895  ORF Transcript_901/g.1895 Transcript_901/m.1895 type:complete len:206 (-) Transcript_901:85-702(-)
MTPYIQTWTLTVALGEVGASRSPAAAGAGLEASQEVAVEAEAQDGGVVFTQTCLTPLVSISGKREETSHDALMYAMTIIRLYHATCGTLCRGRRDREAAEARGPHRRPRNRGRAEGPSREVERRERTRSTEMSSDRHPLSRAAAARMGMHRCRAAIGGTRRSSSSIMLRTRIGSHPHDPSIRTNSRCVVRIYPRSRPDDDVTANS